MPTALYKHATQTTTVRLPKPLYDEAKALVDENKVPSLNDLMITAVRAFLRSAERRSIDAAFAGMAEDAEYQKEAKLIAEQFEASDWETLEISNQDIER